MTGTGALRVGDVILCRGTRWRIEAVDGVQLHLAGRSGEQTCVPVADVVVEPDFAVVVGTPSRRSLARNDQFDRLPDPVQREALWWQGHLTDVIDGSRFDGRGPNFDPDLTTVRQRERTKAAQLVETGHRVSLSTLQRRRLRYQSNGLIGLVDQRFLRPTRAGARVDPRVRDALAQVLVEGTDGSSVTLDRIRRDLRDLLVQRHGPDHGLAVPSPATLRRMVQEIGRGRHPTGSARTRRSLAQQPQRQMSAIHPARPGEFVEVDSTSLDVAVVMDDGVIGRVELSAMVDVATRTVMAQVLRPTTKAVDVAALLAHALTPNRCDRAGPTRCGCLAPHCRSKS